MIILQLILILFLIVITILIIALIIVRRITWKLKRTVRKTFGDERKNYYDTINTINNLYKNKKIKNNEGEYVEFEEIKP
jgi:ABC-type bacteriocin/lantibiotic exporter with double-glycine peptidase domain